MNDLNGTEESWLRCLMTALTAYSDGIAATWTAYGTEASDRLGAGRPVHIAHRRVARVMPPLSAPQQCKTHSLPEAVAPAASRVAGMIYRCA